MQETRPIDMQALRIFLTTAQDCNMSKAAERLGITQSAVSQSIRLLEENFGTPLLNRSARPLTLTAAGLTLVNRGTTLLNQAMNLRGSVIEASQGIKPNLRVGLVDSFAASCGTPLVQELLRGTAQLSVRTGLTPNLAEALVRRELDLVISTRTLDIEGIGNHFLMSERFLVIAPKGLAFPCTSMADLVTLSKQLPLIRFNAQSHLGTQVERSLRQAGISSARRLEVETADTLTSMVAGGIGWAVTTPLCLLQGARSAGALHLGFVPELNAERRLYLHVRTGEYGQLGKETFELAATVLGTHARNELQAINPILPQLIQLHPWVDAP
ncbi:LysR family transcriptional regulator [Alcaligenes faecalis]|uniref:LysR family transcriptional regulator n=1 Tax=Alcaligenes faecalis TaxID=511 RepID=UPI0012932442|nr:LysR family transcriptional regulator [Alcaligenes faecalis]MBX6963949.1 LysR family transcriptional regulator [Providencia rettgeri]MBX7030599.1 LysR family transcriptional regulator [Alcaligenes faecalis]QFY78037.1 LysR family transcriptional regulator [Alcaligenes faecalis]